MFDVNASLRRIDANHRRYVTNERLQLALARAHAGMLAETVAPSLGDADDAEDDGEANRFRNDTSWRDQEPDEFCPDEAERARRADLADAGDLT